MKKQLVVVGLLLTTVLGAGCVVIDVEEEYSREPTTVVPRETTVQEIDAVGRLGFEDNRYHAFKRIAERSNLSDAVQVHLVEAAFEKLGFEDSRMDVMLTLVANPCFSSAGEAALLERIDRLGFEDNRQRILEAIAKRKS
jgi:hypothetical protein